MGCPGARSSAERNASSRKTRETSPYVPWQLPSSGLSPMKSKPFMTKWLLIEGMRSPEVKFAWATSTASPPP